MAITRERNGKSRLDDFLKVMTAKTNEKTEPISKILFTHIRKILFNHSKKISPSILNYKPARNKEGESNDDYYSLNFYFFRFIT